ncbi:hypothetical protein BM1_06097 [Bipolaris maydis]|nr:hypothetical protein BM1_06097 [Bipolaris maydis]
MLTAQRRKSADPVVAFQLASTSSDRRQGQQLRAGLLPAVRTGGLAASARASQCARGGLGAAFHAKQPK